MALIVIGLGWLAGLVAVGAFGAPWWMGAAWAAAAAPLVVFSGLIGKPWQLLAIASVAALVSGWLLDHAELQRPAWTEVLGEEATVTGTVVSEPNSGDTTTGYVIDVDRVESGATLFEGGRVIAFLHQYAEYLPGDRLKLEGALEEPPRFEGFDYREYLVGQGIYATMFRPRVTEETEGDPSFTRSLTELRLELDESLQRALPAPEAALAGGIAFGRDDDISDESKENFNRSGLRHLVAVSGSNVALVAALTITVAVPTIGRRWAWAPAALAIAVYLCAAGLSPSVLRAGVMAAVLLGGWIVGRPQSGLPALFAAVMVMTAFDPRLAYEPGFQLSAAATAGLITLAPWFAHWLLRATAKAPVLVPPRWVCEAIALTTAASVATAPIVWVTFEQVSIVAPLANVIVQPFFAAAFGLSLLTAGLGLVSAPVAELPALATYYPLAFIESVADWLGSPSWAVIELSGGSPAWAVAAFTVLGVVALAAYRFPPGVEAEPRAVRATRTSRQRLVIFAGSGALAIAVIPVSLQLRGGPGELEVAFLDVGQGDAILVTTPHGQQVLIVGGSSGSRVVAQLAEVMPHWDRSLQQVVYTHPQEDHIGGLAEVAARFEVGEFSGNGFRSSSLSYTALAEEASEVTTLSRGDSFERDGVRFEVLWPPADLDPETDLNDTSLVVRVTYGQTSILLMGDSEGPVHEALVEEESLAADVLKVPHHGSKTTPAWLFAEVNPAVAVISVGSGNIYGHPHPDTLEALGSAPIFRTDLDGRIVIRSDGSEISVSTER